MKEITTFRAVYSLVDVERLRPADAEKKYKVQSLDFQGIGFDEEYGNPVLYGVFRSFHGEQFGQPYVVFVPYIVHRIADHKLQGFRFVQVGRVEQVKA